MARTLAADVRASIESGSDGSSRTPGDLNPRARGGTTPDTDVRPTSTITVGKVVGWLLSLAITVGIFVFLIPKLSHGGDVKAELAAVGVTTWAAVMAAGLGKIAVDQWQYIVLLPGLRFRESTVSNLAATAVSDTFPAGSAISVGLTYSMQLSWGFRLRDIARASVTGGVFTTFVKLGLPVTAVLAVIVTGNGSAELVATALVASIALAGAIVVFALALRSERFARRLGALGERCTNRILRWLRRPLLHGWADATARFFEQTGELVRLRWPMIVFTQVLPKVATAGVLWVALRSVGVSSSEVGGLEIWVAYVATTVATMIPITPGGMGITEAVLIAVLGAGESPTVTAQITAAVIVYRAATWLLPIVLGAPCFVFWRVNKTWRKTASDRYPASLTGIDPARSEGVEPPSF